jgi:hypothetical protein
MHRKVLSDAIDFAAGPNYAPIPRFPIPLKVRLVDDSVKVHVKVETCAQVFSDSHPLPI